MKILLICPSANPAAIENSSYPLGLLYLASVLERDNHEVMVKDYFKDPFESVKEEIIDLIKNYSPDVIGINCTTLNRMAGFEIAKITKEKSPKIKIIMGGVHATALYKQILENFPIDIIVLGEGEITISELIKAFSKNIKLENIKGIAFKKNKDVIFTGIREAIKNLDELPFPKHELCEDAIKKSKTAVMMTSRGCPFGCIFCSTCAYWGRKWRARTPKNVVDEMEHIIKRFSYVERIFFHDDEFTIDNQRVINICDEIMKRRIKIKWGCSSRVDTVSEEMLIKMKQAGCDEIDYGVESGSQKMLDSMGKKITLEQTKNAIELTNKVGIPYHPFMIIGVPGENWDTINETINFIKELKNADIGNGVAGLQIYPNTPIYELAKKQGIIDDSWWLKNNTIPFYTFENSRDELNKMAYYIIEKNQLQKGFFNLLAFSTKFFFQKPKKALKYILFRTGLMKNK